MPSTYEPIATYTIPSPQSSYTFTNISQAYTDIIFVYEGAMVSADYVLFRVGNGSIDSGANYGSTRLVGSGSTTSSGRDVNATFIAAPEPLNTNRNNLIMQFSNYSNTNVNKTALLRANVPLSDGGATSTIGAVVGTWRSNSAINQIRITSFAGQNFATGSTFTLYGIKAA
jgi:hypothetical protein